jgi:hypothetical protein
MAYILKFDCLFSVCYDKMTQSKAGSPWSNEEERELLRKLEKGMDVTAIAQVHERTIGGIKSRISHIACRMYQSVVSTDKICKTLKMNTSLLDAIIKKRTNNVMDVETKWVPQYGLFHARDGKKHCNVYMNIGVDSTGVGHIQGTKVVFDFGLVSYGDFDMCLWMLPHVQKATGIKSVMFGKARSNKVLMDDTEKYFNNLKPLIVL